MTILILGLILFLGVHSIRVFAEPLRTSIREKMGPNTYKGLYTLISFVGLGLIIWGYPQTRIDAVYLWHPPAATRHVATLLTLIAFILIAASSVPGNRIKALVKHPMSIGVKVWAFAHLLANGRLGDVILFGAFMVWAILTYRAARERDRINNLPAPAIKGVTEDVITIGAGIGMWALIAFALHGPLIGVRPFG